MTPTALDSALTAPPLRPLPHTVAELLRALPASPRLAAHLRVVHDVAWSLTDALGRRWPTLEFDTTAVLFGAATHDIGRAVPAGSGEDLLLRYGVPAHLARFADTHDSWAAPDRTLDDLLVSLADHIWTADRVPELEQRIPVAQGELDVILTALAAGAPARHAFQQAHPL